MKPVSLIVALILFAFHAFVVGAAIADDGDNPNVANIQRTLARMAASTPDDPATVRWMFYGQSITAQPWTKLVEQDLARRFPSVNFVFHKPAIGGFTSPALIRTAEHDLYPWYPDLLVFHVYGPVDKYEEIISNVRARTTAEIVLWTSHLNAKETLDTNPDVNERIVAIREIAKRHDCMLIDVRNKCLSYKKLQLPDGFQIKWKTYPLFTARYEPQPAGTETVLVQNCATGKHRLTLRGSAARSGLTVFRVYAPASVQHD